MDTIGGWLTTTCSMVVTVFTSGPLYDIVVEGSVLFCVNKQISDSSEGVGECDCMHV